MTVKIPKGLNKLKNSEPLRSLARTFRAAFPKGELYLAGGSVRDCLLGRTDSKDYDLVVRGVEPERLERFLGKKGRVDLVGKRFGVWKLVPFEARPRGVEAKPLQASQAEVSPHTQAIDIALPRTESSFNSGGYRDVAVGSDPHLKIEKDLARRDFTVNAMALRLTPKPALIDPCEGRKDLKKKIIRTVGHPGDRFREDFSRMLRGLRFACQLKFKIEDHTMAGIHNLMPHINDYRSTPEGNMRVVATEIIAREFAKALTADPVRALDLWDETGAVTALMPELLAMRGCKQPTNFHTEGDVWQHTRLALTKIGDKDFIKRFGKDKPPALLYFAVLFHDIGKPPTMQTPEEHGTDRIRYNDHDRVGAEMTAATAQRLTLSAAEGFDIDTDKLYWLIRFHLFTVHGAIDEIRPSTLEKYFFNPNQPGRELLMLIYCDSMATVPQGGITKAHLQHLDALMKRIDELAALGAGKKLPPPLLDGNAIMKMLKLKPGPEVGRIIAALREAQLEGKVANTKEAEKHIKSF